MIKLYNIVILTIIFAFMIIISSTMNLNNKLSSIKTVNNSYQNIILYDGVCNFCNKWVDFILKIDKKKKFSFCALQSDNGKELLEYIGKDRNDLSSVIYIKKLSVNYYNGYDKKLTNDNIDNNKVKTTTNNNNEIYIKSEAALRVAEELGYI